MNSQSGYDLLQCEGGHRQQPQPQQPNSYSTGMVGCTNVVVQSPVEVAPSAPVHWDWCHLVTAVISIFCCSCFGVIATVSSILAYVDHKGKDYGRSIRKRNLALGFGIAGIVIGVMVIICYIIVITTVMHKDLDLTLDFGK